MDNISSEIEGAVLAIAKMRLLDKECAEVTSEMEATAAQFQLESRYRQQMRRVDPRLNLWRDRWGTWE